MKGLKYADESRVKKKKTLREIERARDAADFAFGVRCTQVF